MPPPMSLLDQVQGRHLCFSTHYVFHGGSYPAPVGQELRETIQSLLKELDEVRAELYEKEDRIRALLQKVPGPTFPCQSSPAVVAHL